MTPPEASATLPRQPDPAEPDFYYEGPFVVFTEAYHLRRGSCCHSGCRHCPWRESLEQPEH